jgi:3-oxoadipate enol-lactonase
MDSAKQKNSAEGSYAREILANHEADAIERTHLSRNLDVLKMSNPGLGRFVNDDMFGNVAPNSSLDYRGWAMMALAALIALGDTSDQLQVYTRSALQQGATREEILDVFSHAAVYCGAPRAVTAMRRVSGLLDGSVPTFTERVVHLHDHRTIVRDSGGQGVPIVLIHALCMDGRMWREVMPHLTGAARVIAYDTRGHGYSRGAPLTESLGHLADDLSQLLDTLGVERADVYGQSYGGAIAQYFAHQHPNRIRSLALITTSAEAQTEAWLGRATKAEAHGISSILSESIIRWFSPEAIAQNNWAVRYARTCVERARVEDWAAAWRAMAKLDCKKMGKDFKGPVLVVCGAQDLSTGPPIMRKTAEAWHAEYKEINPGTHMMALEQPEQLVEELLAFRQSMDK